MAKVSKVSVGRAGQTSRPAEPPKPDDREAFYCCRCRKKYRRQGPNFPQAQSTLYSGNNGYLHICNNCVTELYQHYREALGSTANAIQRMCMKLDVYWNPAACKVAIRGKSPDTYMLAYLTKMNTVQFLGRTYDDTIDEECANTPTMVVTDIDEDGNETPIEVEPLVPPEVRNFWRGFPERACLELQDIYDGWTAVDDPDAYYTREQLRIIKQISILEWRINTGARQGTKISDDVAQYNSLISAANLKPSTQKAEDKSDNDILTFGTGIKEWENDRPIPDPDPEFADVDGIVRYISIWFLGHLCHILKIKNSYSQMYEDEMARRRVERPEYSGEDDEAFFNDIFSSGGDADD